MPVRSCFLLAALLCVPLLGPGAEETGELAFEMKEIDKGLDIGYAVLPVDVNGDKKTDIVVVDTHRVVWYENPTWKRRLILDKTTKPHNVCVAAADIDGDGKIDLALGAETDVEPVHAMITRRGSGWVLSDADTPNGTLLNGQRLTAPAPLRSGDRIQVGGCVLSFEGKTTQPVPPPPVGSVL